MSTATATHITPCPVAALAREAKQLFAAAELAEEREHTAAPEELTRAKVARKEADGRLSSAEERASFLRATEPVGALFQVHLILTLAELIASWVPEDHHQADLCARSLRAVTRMAYSVRNYIGETTGADPEEAGASYYMSSTFDPHRLLAELITGQAGDAEPDPMMEAIDAFRRGLDAYNRQLPDDATDESCAELAANTYESPMRRLQFDAPTPTTFAGAVAAVRLVHDEVNGAVFSEDLVVNVLGAALRYFGGSDPAPRTA
jgi:hypothetical protein